MQLEMLRREHEAEGAAAPRRGGDDGDDGAAPLALGLTAPEVALSRSQHPQGQSACRYDSFPSPANPSATSHSTAPYEGRRNTQARNMDVADRLNPRDFLMEDEHTHERERRDSRPEQAGPSNTRSVGAGTRRRRLPIAARVSSLDSPGESQCWVRADDSDPRDCERASSDAHGTVVLRRA